MVQPLAWHLARETYLLAQNDLRLSLLGYMPNTTAFTIPGMVSLIRFNCILYLTLNLVVRIMRPVPTLNYTHPNGLIIREKYNIQSLFHAG